MHAPTLHLHIHDPTVRDAFVDHDKLSFTDDVSSAEVLVSDDAQWLDRVRSDHPTSLRVWVSDRCEAGVLDYGHAHHLLCGSHAAHDLGLLMCTRSADHMDGLHRLPGRGRLPTLSGSVQELLKVLDDPNVTSAQVKRVMASDPSMVAKTLQIANSPLFQQRRRVSTLDRAIVLLGLANLRIAAMTSGFFAPVRGVPTGELEACRDAGLLAMHAVRDIAGSHAEVAVTAALLLDVGKLLLIQHDPDYPMLVQRAVREGRSVVDLERDTYGTTHAEQGGRLLAGWGLPHDVCEAITLSHTPLPHPQRGLDTRALVFVASELVDAAVQRRPYGRHLEALVAPNLLEECSESLADHLLAPAA